MEDDFTDLQRLLRLKRHEIPAPEFFEEFLAEFHQRQRAELLKRPLWRLALDRLEGAMPTFQLPQYGYAAACALAVLFAGVAAKHIVTTPVTSLGNGHGLAANGVTVEPPIGTGPKYYAPLAQVVAKSPRFNFTSRSPVVSLAELDFDAPRHRSGRLEGGLPNSALCAGCSARKL